MYDFLLTSELTDGKVTSYDRIKICFYPLPCQPSLQIADAEWGSRLARNRNSLTKKLLRGARHFTILARGDSFVHKYPANRPPSGNNFRTTWCKSALWLASQMCTWFLLIFAGLAFYAHAFQCSVDHTQFL